MDLEFEFSNKIDDNVDGVTDKVLKCLIELQTLRNQNQTLKKDLANSELNKQNLVYEVDKLRQTSKDLKCQIDTAYNVINAFNKQQADRNSIFTHQTIKVEAVNAENNFLMEQVSTFQENISKLTIEKLELLAKCQQLEINSTIFDEKYTNAWKYIQSLEKAVNKLEENHKVVKTLIDKTKVDVNRVNESINSYKSEKIQMNQTNRKMSEKISELLLRLPIDAQTSNTLIDECEKLTTALAYEKSKNLELSNSLAICVSNQSELFKTYGDTCNKSVQTENT